MRHVLTVALTLFALSAFGQERYSVEEIDRALQATAPRGDMMWLTRQCRIGGEGYSLCTGYITGMVAKQDVQAVIFRDEPLFCIAISVQPETLRRTVLSWADAYPDYLYKPAALGVLAALREAYPCGQ